MKPSFAYWPSVASTLIIFSLAATGGAFVRPEASMADAPVGGRLEEISQNVLKLREETRESRQQLLSLSAALFRINNKVDQLSAK